MWLRDVPASFYAFIGGVTIGTSLLAPWTAFLAPIGLAVLIYAVSVHGSLRQRLIRGWWGGCGKYLVVLSWGWHTYPLTWVGVDSALVAIGLIATFWFLTAAVMGVGTAVFGGLHHMVPSRWLLAPLWVMTEILSSLLYSLFLLGPGSRLNVDFSFGHIGYALAAHPFTAATAKPFDVYGMSLIVAIIAVGMVELYERKKLWVWYLGVAAASVVVCANILPQQPPRGMSVAIVDTSFDAARLAKPEGREEKGRDMVEAVRAALALPVDYVVLPEDSRFTAAAGGMIRAQELYATSTPILVDSGRVELPFGTTVLRSYIYYPGSTTPAMIDKQYLAPLGEFLSYVVSVPLDLLPATAWRDRLYQHMSYQIGSENTLGDVGELPAVLFCMEAVAPFGATEAYKRHAGPFIAHPVSHTWFTDSYLLDTQQLAMLRVRAVSSGQYIVVAGNEYEGRVVRPDGTVLVPLDTTAEGNAWRIRTVSI